MQVDSWRLYTTGDPGYVQFLREIIACETEILKAMRGGAR